MCSRVGADSSKLISDARAQHCVWAWPCFSRLVWRLFCRCDTLRFKSVTDDLGRKGRDTLVGDAHEVDGIVTSVTLVSSL